MPYTQRVMNTTNLTLVTFTFSLDVRIAGETRTIEFWGFEGDEKRAFSRGQVAVCRVNGGKLWPCSLRAWKQSDGSWKVSMQDVRLNRQYPVTGWREEAYKCCESQHNGR